MRRPPMRPSKRFAIWRRDGFRCTYCGASALSDQTLVLEVDHVTPVVLGGTDDPSNLTTACHPCNRKKGPKGTRKAQPPRPLFTDAEHARRDAQWAVIGQWHANLEERIAQVQANGESLTRALFAEEVEILSAAIEAAS